VKTCERHSPILTATVRKKKAVSFSDEGNSSIQGVKECCQRKGVESASASNFDLSRMLRIQDVPRFLLW
jgi:hypothetical protein